MGAWEPRCQACHFYNLAFSGLKERFSVATHVPRPERQKIVIAAEILQ